MQETLDFYYFGVIPNDLVLMRRIVVALREDGTSRSKTVCEADDLVEHYAERWDARRDIRHFFETGGLRQHIERALLKRRFFERLAPEYEACSLVLEIFREFEIYVSQYEKSQAFIKKQRSLASNKRRHFFAQVAERDGAFCKFCQTTENLRLDHTHPVVLGGLSVLDNFQILCFQCNSRKGKGERAIHHPQAFYSFARNRREALLYLLTAISYCEKRERKTRSILNNAMDKEKRSRLIELQEQICATIEKAWLFPSSGNVQGFLGTGPLMIVAERPSTGTFFRAPDQLLYKLLDKYGAANAHLTDVIKSRGKVGAPYPEDIRQDRFFFDRELEIVQPKRIITFGQKVHDLLQFTLAGSGISVIQTWHYAYPGRYPQHRPAFEEQMKNACELS